MNSKYLISVKSSGLCFNIMRLIILTDIAKKYNRTLYFLTKPDHIPILKKFNNNCIYIPYIDSHTEQYNNFTRNKNIHILYDLKYISFLKKVYLNNIFNEPPIKDFTFFSGNAFDISDTDKKFLVIDYNDGMYDTEIINSIEIEPLVVASNILNNISRDSVTINIKINVPASKRIYKFWDEIIPLIKKQYNQPIFLISGNNDILKYLGSKYDCGYRSIATETNYSNVRGNDIVRGKPDEIFSDIIICSLTNFIPFTRLRRDYPGIMSRYTDLNFVVEKVEKFDILVEYLAKYITAPEP